MALAYIGIGSNVEREKNIRSALGELSGLGSNMRVSPVYESPAYGFEGNNFYNLAVVLDTTYSARELSSKLQQIEGNHGRTRDVPRYSSRTIDLDLLLYDDLVTHDDGLDLPRSDIESRAFVLRPLNDIAADTIHPERGLKIGEIWATFNQQGQELWEVELDLAS